jgi:hypothetical protein
MAVSYKKEIMWLHRYVYVFIFYLTAHSIPQIVTEIDLETASQVTKRTLFTVLSISGVLQDWSKSGRRSA